MFQFFLGSNPKGLLYTDNPRNRFRPISDLSGESGLTLVPNYGSTLWTCVNDQDINQYGEVSIIPTYLSTTYFGLEPFPEAINHSIHQVRVRIYASANQPGLKFYRVDAGTSYALPDLELEAGVSQLYEIDLTSINESADHELKIAVLSPLELTINFKVFWIDVIVTPKISGSGFFFRMCGL